MMRWKPLAWFLVSLLCFVAAMYFWQWGERRSRQDGVSLVKPTGETASASSASVTGQLLSVTTLASTSGIPAFVDESFPNRLRNTPAPVRALVRSETALLLENALLDTAFGSRLAIPDHLRSQGDPGTYIVQARGTITEAFRTVIQSTGGTVVSYVPNNAYLVRASAGAAAAMEGSPLTHSVVAFEPYFKIKGDLLNTAVTQAGLPQGNLLSLVLFPDAAVATREALEQMGGTIVAEDRSPFGPVLKVQVPVDALAVVAALPGVQVVDRAYERVLANDLSRARIGVSENSSNAPNYLDLTGSNIVIQINDSGVDATHPDLVGRVMGDSPLSLEDTDGHGTHVAGTIIGNGMESTTVSNAPGSFIPPLTNQFRGMAPAAKLFSVRSANPDWFLQESAALTNALISNNSWNQQVASYDIVAASYDAAVRDSLPAINGSQPVMYVFAAGNQGAGSDEGQGGIPDTILSPATAKNVITVGAIENFRDITNDVVICEGDTNSCVTNEAPFQVQTDTDWEVASFSSRGNVGIGVEGEFGRFKPDVVAPGTFVLSARSAQWDTNAYYNPREREVNTLYNNEILPGEVNGYLTYIPENAVEFEIYVTTPPAQPPLPDLPIYVNTTTFPQPGDTPLGTNYVVLPPDMPLTPLDAVWLYGVGNPTEESVFVNVTTVITTTNNNPVYTQGMKDLNAATAPYYRYENGTSMAAPAISGALALLQEFFQDRMQTTISPALMKAFIINGSRSTSPTYDFQVNNVVNNQGWGVFNLPNVLPVFTNLNSEAGAPVFFYDQSPTNALATGDSMTRQVAVATAAQNQSLRFTLVWTDPPGNPVVGAKLVNNLDLIVTNLDNGEVYVGNNIETGSDFNTAYDPSTTNAIPDPDVVNNVENVYLPAFTGTNFSVTVFARQVNVNAVYDAPNNTVQDYALVISSGNASVETALTVTAPTSTSDSASKVNFLSPLLVSSNIVATYLENQRVGENAPLLGNTNGINTEVNSGMTNQWRFYVMTNSAGFTNATFITFLASTLSLPRMGVFADDDEDASRPEADIDLYVSTDPAITNLTPAAINASLKSLTSGGTEVVVLDDAVADEIYYIGVKSEDHEAANFFFFGSFTLLPPSSSDDEGLTMRGMPVPITIPDGSPAKPGAALVLSVATEPIEIRRVIVTNEITHQNFGDLIGNLSHNNNFAVLNNHTFPEDNPAITNYTYIYEDNGEDDIPGSQPTDGPGSLRSFVGEEGLGVWLLSMLDDSLSQTGRVDEFSIRLERSPETNSYVRTIAPYSWYYDVVNVPPEATNLTIQVEIIGTSPLPVELYIRKGDFPSFNLFDLRTTINPPGGEASITTFDLPPLAPDRYYFGIYNPNSVEQTVRITINVGLGLDARDQQAFTSFEQVPLTDNAVTSTYQYVEDKRRIAGLEVGLQIQHPRVSDLVTHLISPLGKRILLVENRGGTSTNGYGGGSVFTNAFSADSGDAEASTNTISVGANRGTLIVDYDFLNYPDQMRVYYDDELIKDTGMVSGMNTFSVEFGPGISTNLVIIMNELGNGETNTLWNYTATVIGSTLNYLTLTEDANKTTTPIKFAIPPLGGIGSASNILSSGFETAAAGTYTSPAIVEGWSVDTNQVSVVTDAANAYTGSNFLALADGQISRVLPTTVGRHYKLTYAYRGPGIVSFWRAEGDANDSVDGNQGTAVNNPAYVPGEVGQAFQFNGVDQLVELANSQNLNPPAGFSIDSWIFPMNDQTGTILSKWGDAGDYTNSRSYGFSIRPGRSLQLAISDAANQDNGAFHDFTVNGVITLGAWNHVAGVYDQAAGTRRLYVNGTLVGEQVDPPITVLNGIAKAGIGAYFRSSSLIWEQFGGLIDETSFYHRALSASEISAIYRANGAGKFDPMAADPESLAKAQVRVGGAAPEVFYGQNDVWKTGSIEFTADQANTVLEFTGLEPGMLLDAIKVIELPNDLYYLPEESFSSIIGDIAEGVWELEIWDNRAGASNGPPRVVSWQLNFTYETTRQTPIPILPGIAITNDIPPGSILYLEVDVPFWAHFAANALLYATPDPVNVWFNQDIPPVPGRLNSGDFEMLTMSRRGGFTLEVGGTPPLVPDERYYVGIENPGTNTVSIAYQVNFDLIQLTNAVPYLKTSNGLSPFEDYYRFVVTNPVARLQFEILRPTMDITLLASKGLPLPTFASFDYIGLNPGTNEEYIVVLPGSTPVPVSAGDWFLTAVNLSGQSGSYQIKATQFTVTGQPIIVSAPMIQAGSFCFSWNSLPGARYVVQAKVALSDPEWVDHSGTIEAVGNTSSYCVPLPSPYHFFRVVEGVAVDETSTAQISIVSITSDSSGVTLKWLAPPSFEFEVQYSDVFPPVWTTIPGGPITSADGKFTFTDDGSQTGGLPLSPIRYYRLLVLP